MPPAFICTWVTCLSSNLIQSIKPSLFPGHLHLQHGHRSQRRLLEGSGCARAAAAAPSAWRRAWLVQRVRTPEHKEPGSHWEETSNCLDMVWIRKFIWSRSCYTVTVFLHHRSSCRAQRTTIQRYGAQIGLQINAHLDVALLWSCAQQLDPQWSWWWEVMDPVGMEPSDNENFTISDICSLVFHNTSRPYPTNLHDTCLNNMYCQMLVAAGNFEGSCVGATPGYKHSCPFMSNESSNFREDLGFTPLGK